MKLGSRKIIAVLLIGTAIYGGNLSATVINNKVMTATEKEKQINIINNTIYNTTKLKITSNSKLSEYIARNLLQHNTTIKLSGYAESTNTDKVFDAVHEAINQNPLCFSVENMVYYPSKKLLNITYRESNKTEFKKKQQQTIREVKKVILNIIKPGMTDLEKVVAINNYLCDTADYDDAAVTNMQKYNNKKYDLKYVDSFTPYGVLINKIGVCSSYAGAFKLLADEAGLESVVVTGTTVNNENHAWNKVKVNGNWVVVDVTNNDKEDLSNTILNISDKSASNFLKPNKEFVIDSKIINYAAGTDANEYYRSIGAYFTKDAIANEFINRFPSQDSVSLRTDYSITQSEVEKIVDDVLKESKYYGEVTYCSWNGVITIKK